MDSAGPSPAHAGGTQVDLGPGRQAARLPCSVANTEEFEAEWARSRPPKLPWVLLGAVVLVGGWASCSLKSQKDEADTQLRTTHDQLDASQKKLVDLVAQKNTLEPGV